MKRVSIALIAMFLAGAQASAAILPATAFSYDSAKPLNLKVLQQHREGTVTIREVRFDSPKGGTIHGVLMLPAGRQRRGGVLFVHWLGDAKTTNLTEFHRDGLALARRGSIALLIDAMWAQPDWYDKIRSPETDYANSIKQVVDLRRSIDLLLSQPGIDAHRIAYVGHDFGAMYGAVMAGVDSRVRWYALIAGTTSFADWYLYGAQPKDKSAFFEQMAQLDPTQYLAKSKAEEFLFQFAKNDRYIPIDKAVAFVNSAPLPHGMFLYDTNHSVSVPAAYADRMAWLEVRL